MEDDHTICCKKLQIKYVLLEDVYIFFKCGLATGGLNAGRYGGDGKGVWEKQQAQKGQQGGE